MKRYNNYHKHSHLSNIYTPDTHIKNEDYCKRAVELGHTNIFTTEHGFSGDIFEVVNLGAKYNLNPICAMEGYIVADASSKDAGNYHIIIVPKNDKTRKQLNLASSRANTEGFYYKPRLFLEDLLKFNPNDFILTTACCGGLLKNKDSFNNIFMPLYKHFKNNIYLEVQIHNVDSQKKINERALTLRDTLGLKLIHANDSHYIYPEDAKDRLLMLKGKNITYDEEDTYILDYPDYNTIVKRYELQGVLTKSDVEEALENTLIFDDIHNIEIDKTIKMPNIYPDLSPEARILKLKQIIKTNFSKLIKTENITDEEMPKYIKALNEEIEVIEETKEIHTMDYFLFNERMVDIATNTYKGYLTPTSRGSGGAYLINKMLGMTQLDRIRSEITLYPERFMSSARLLGDNPPYTSSLPDFDFNIISDEPFVRASRDLLGKHGCYAMTAYGTMGESESFRNVCRARDLDYNEYNEVAKDLDSYRDDEKWKPIFEEAKKFDGTIISASIHPCSFLLLDKDLREELGIIKIGDAFCCPITSSEADEWHYLKNDYLKVESISLSKNSFNLAGIPIPSIYEFKNMLDDKVWDIYSNGLTCTINQFDSPWATSLSKQYKPRSVKEVAMFNGAIRPNFNDYRDSFMSRDTTFTNGNDFLDRLFEETNKYCIYQENLLKYFEELGIKPSESISLIKKISKKKIKPEHFDALVERLKKGWLKAVGSMDGFDETWEKIQTFMSYGFNSPHSLAMAYDSLYEAYAKSHFPLEYYTVALEMYKGDERRTNTLSEELKYFGIEIEQPRFRYSKSEYMRDIKNNKIYKGMSSCKYVNETIGNQLYDLRNEKIDNPIELFNIMKEATSTNARQREILIKLDFFEEFGGAKYLLRCVDVFENIIKKKQFKKDNLPLGLTEDDIRPFASKETEKIFKEVDTVGLAEQIINKYDKYEKLSLKERFEAEEEYLGYISYTDNSYNDDVVFISNIKVSKWGTAFADLYRISDGAKTSIKIDKDFFKVKPLSKGDVIRVVEFKDKEKKKRDEKGRWVGTGVYEKILTKYGMVEADE